MSKTLRDQLVAAGLVPAFRAKLQNEIERAYLRAESANLVKLAEKRVERDHKVLVVEERRHREEAKARPVKPAAIVATPTPPTAVNGRAIMNVPPDEYQAVGLEVARRIEATRKLRGSALVVATRREMARLGYRLAVAG